MIKPILFLCVCLSVCVAGTWSIISPSSSLCESTIYGLQVIGRQQNITVDQLEQVFFTLCDKVSRSSQSFLNCTQTINFDIHGKLSSILNENMNVADICSKLIDSGSVSVPVHPVSTTDDVLPAITGYTQYLKTGVSLNDTDIDAPRILDNSDKTILLQTCQQTCDKDSDCSGFMVHHNDNGMWECLLFGSYESHCNNREYSTAVVNGNDSADFVTTYYKGDCFRPPNPPTVAGYKLSLYTLISIDFQKPVIQLLNKDQNTLANDCAKACSALDANVCGGFMIMAPMTNMFETYICWGMSKASADGVSAHDEGYSFYARD